MIYFTCLLYGHYRFSLIFVAFPLAQRGTVAVHLDSALVDNLWIFCYLM